ncbi:MAG: helix-turn-helix domain-containing protein [Polyangiales bacterium]
MLDGGLSLLARGPIDAISIDELVAAAGVAKGSFFNHFEDKTAFAAAIFAAVRGELEAAVGGANATVTDPLERLSGGMIVAAGFALADPLRFSVMVQTARGTTLVDHPLNAGVAKDLRACVRAGAIRADTQRSGVAFWIGCCHTLMTAIVDQRASRDRALDLLSDMLVLGLTGLGAERAAVERIVSRSALRAKLQVKARAEDPAPAPRRST